MVKSKHINKYKLGAVQNSKLLVVFNG